MTFLLAALMLLRSCINCQISSPCREKGQRLQQRSLEFQSGLEDLFISELGLPVVQLSLVKMCLQVPVKSPLTGWKHTCPFRDGLYTCRAVKHQGQSKREWSGTRRAGAVSADCSRGKTRTRSHTSAHGHLELLCDTWRKRSAGIPIQPNSSLAPVLVCNLKTTIVVYRCIFYFFCSWDNHVSWKWHVISHSDAGGKWHHDEWTKTRKVLQIFTMHSSTEMCCKYSQSKQMQKCAANIQCGVDHYWKRLQVFMAKPN